MSSWANRNVPIKRVFPNKLQNQLSLLPSQPSLSQPSLSQLSLNNDHNNILHQSNTIKIPNVSPIPLNDSLESILLNNMLYNIENYDKLLSKIQLFMNNHTDALITYIIPTINRKSLYLSLLSILNQTITNWKVIIIFDGCEPTDPLLLGLLDNSRILYFSINKSGEEHDEEKSHGSAGEVRNIGMKLVTTPWIGFVDDDDRIDSKYIERLVTEINLTNNLDVIIFRMIEDYNIIPSIISKEIKEGNIGISFAINTHLIHNGFFFQQSRTEDYYYIKQLQQNLKKIVISPFIAYYVRNSIYINVSNLPRVILN